MGAADRVDADVVLAVHQLYGRQSHAIDGGDATGWAATFTADGEFASPSYPQPTVGRAALTAFAERFAATGRANGEVQRHVLNTVHVAATPEPGVLDVRGYLQILATPAGGSVRLVRSTTIRDQVVAVGGDWLVHRRTVSRDDAPAA
jgi:hypothetical protein